MDNRYSLSEIVGWLRLDKKLKILFVEGNRDLSFWRKHCPLNERENSRIYCATLLRIGSHDDNNRAKIIDLAQKQEMAPYLDRCMFFIDADNFHLFKTALPGAILITDHRDLESYGFDEKCIADVVDCGLAREQENVTQILESVESICRPIGILRAISEEEQLNLPFAKTFDKEGRKKFLGKQNKFNFDKMVNTLIQNSSISLSRKNGILELHRKKMAQFNGYDPRKVVHGKDWIYFFATMFDLEPDSAEALIFMGIGSEICETQPALFRVKAFLRSTEKNDTVGSPADGIAA